MNQDNHLHVYDVLAKAFLQEDVGAYFALLGDANMFWATRLAEAGCRMVFVRHEHCAVGAAAAYTRKTGQIAVASMTCGPGLTQVMTSLSIAVKARIPMVVFAGESPISRGWYNQEIEQAPFVLAAGAAYRALHWPDRMPVAVRDAFVQAKRERRPVVVGVPLDLQEEAWTGPETLPSPSAVLMPRLSPMPPNPEDVRRAAELIDAAERIVVMAGLGAIAARAGDSCRTLAERCGGLLAESLPARGFFHDDPWSLGLAGGLSTPATKKVFAEADLVIAVGCSLAHFNADGGKLWPEAEVLQVDVDPVAINQGRVAAEAHLRADARLGVEALVAAIASRPGQWRSADIAGTLRTNRAPRSYATGPAPSGHDPRDVVAALDQMLPTEWELVTTSGHVASFTSIMPARRHDRFLTIREFGAIGNGTSFAIGVATASPDRTVVLLEGDGSFLMHVQELETIRRHGMNVLVIVLNDGDFGSEIHKLDAKGMSTVGAHFGRTDFAAVANGFGLGGARIDDLATLPGMIADFAKAGGAAVWDIPIIDAVSSRRTRSQAQRT